MMNPRDNYFVKLVKYIKNVYHIDKNIKHATDKRVNPTYKTSQIISLVLMGFLLRIQSFNELKCMIKSGEFDSLVIKNDKIPKIDTELLTLYWTVLSRHVQYSFLSTW